MRIHPALPSWIGLAVTAAMAAPNANPGKAPAPTPSFARPADTAAKSPAPPAAPKSAPATPAAPGALYDGIAAVVGDEIILFSEVEELRQGFEQQQPGFASEPLERQRREALDRLVDEKVLLVEAKQDTTIKIQDKEVNGRVDDHVARLVEQQGGESKLETLLKQTNGMTLAQFKAKLAQQVKEQLYKQRLQYKYAGDPEPSQLQVQEFYRQFRDSLPPQKDSYKLSHLQVKIKPNKRLEDSAYARADSLIQRLDKGESFADLAKRYSDDPSGKDGGDIGYTKKGSLDPEYEKAAFALGLGDYTAKPVRSRLGYHVIRVTGKKDVEVRTSHILVALRPDARDTARASALADSLRQASAAKPGAFASLAQAFSDDRKTKDKGGDLGWFPRDQLDQAYAPAIRKLAPGQVTEPILIGDSYHLFRLDQKADERRLNPKEDWSQLAFLAKNWIVSKKMSALVDGWRPTIHIEKRLDQYAKVGRDEDEAGAGEDAGTPGDGGGLDPAGSR